MENLSPILMPSAIDLIFKQILICQIADECFEPTIRWRWCIYTESIFFGLCERTFDDWWRTKCLKLRILYMDSQFSIRIHSSYIFIQYKFSQTIVLSVFSTHVVAFSFSFFFAFYHVWVYSPTHASYTMCVVSVCRLYCYCFFFFSSPFSFSRLPKSKIVVCRSSYLILFCIVSYRKSTENIACKGEKGGINCKHRMR